MDSYPNFENLLNSVFKVSSYMVRIDLDKEKEDDLKTGKGFIVSHHHKINKDIKGTNSIFSPAFGDTLSSVDEFISDYKCPCGYTTQKIYNGTKCPMCGGIVTRRENKYDMFGWISIDDEFVIIHPNFYKELEVVIGADKLLNIINPNDVKDINGYSIKSEKIKKDEPYYGKGILFLRDNLEEILDFYYRKTANKKSKIEFLTDILSNKNLVFTHSIPVYTTLLRPFRLDSNNKFGFNDVNGLYNMMVKLANDINKNELSIHKKKKPKLQLLYDLQIKLNKLYNEITDILNGKKGVFKQLFGGRYNFTTRNVIVGDPRLRVDQVKLSYFALVGMMEQRIINTLVKAYNMNYDDAYNTWYKSTMIIDERIFNILKSYIENDCDGLGIPVFINRPPTIMYGSIAQVFVVDIMRTHTMAVSLRILNAMKADFDGDVLTILWAINKALIQEGILKLNPANAFNISRNDGLFNQTMNHCRDVIVNINSFLNLTIDNYSEEQLRLIEIAKNYKD